MKAGAAHEKKRIRDAGGIVINGRIEGLEPSRTIGDFDVKMRLPEGVISITPEIRRMELPRGQETSQGLLVMATDGVWDVLSGQDIVSLLRPRSKEICGMQQKVTAMKPAGGKDQKVDTRVLKELS